MRHKIPPANRQGVIRQFSLPLPVGEVAERSEDGEGKRQDPLSHLR